MGRKTAKSFSEVGPKLKQEADQVFALAQGNSEWTEAPFTLEELSKDKNFTELCDLIKTMLAPIK